MTLETTGAVTALDAGPRRQVSPAVGGLTFRRTTVTGGQTPSVGAAAGPSLQSRQDGGLDARLPGSPAGAALSVEGATGHVGIAAGSGALAAALQVGGGVHTGGADAGFSFMDQQVSGYVDAPTAGERWRWYADAGYARLWSGTDQLSVGQPGDGGGLDVPRRMRVRQGADDSAGIWLWQNDTPQAAFVGMSDSSHVGLWGLGVGWGLTMDVASGALSTQGDLAVHGSVVVDANLSAGGTVGFLPVHDERAVLAQGPGLHRRALRSLGRRRDGATVRLRPLRPGRQLAADPERRRQDVHARRRHGGGVVLAQGSGVHRPDLRSLGRQRNHVAVRVLLVRARATVGCSSRAAAARPICAVR